MATQGLYRFTLVCAIIAFVFMFVAFASPFWYQSWRRVHSPFGNIGLWHVCLNGFIMPRDPVMKSYVGCWWIHSTEFSLVKDQIQPGEGLSFICLIASSNKVCLFYLRCSISQILHLSLNQNNNCDNTY